MGTWQIVRYFAQYKYLVEQKSGLHASDEAFKAAYTDAIGNAMKFIGVAADVYMGLFDDNKYIAEMKEEFSKAEKKPAGPKFIPKAKAEQMKVIAIGRADQYDQSLTNVE
jgi:hypothetical protein